MFWAKLTIVLENHKKNRFFIFCNFHYFCKNIIELYGQQKQYNPHYCARQPVVKVAGGRIYKKIP